MKIDDRKYLTLTGYPLHVPLWKTFHQTAGVQAGMLFSAFTVVADMMVNDGANLPELLPVSLVAPAITTLTHKVMEAALIDDAFMTNLLRLRFKGAGRKLAIDTKPAEYLTTPSDLSAAARSVRNSALLISAGYTGMLGMAITVIPNYVPLTQNNILMGGVIAGHILSSFVGTFAACAYRFNKVVKGDHVIVDAPPKKKPEEVEALSGSRHAPSPV